jgi:hypothetical protein
MGNWLIDGAGLFGGLVGPLIGLLLLYDRFSRFVDVVYALVILSVGGFDIFVDRVQPQGYANRPLLGVRPFWVLTPVAILAVLINVIAGVAVLIAGP